MADATGKLYWYKLLIAEDTREGAVPVANISTMYDLAFNKLHAYQFFNTERDKNHTRSNNRPSRHFDNLGQE